MIHVTKLHASGNDFIIIPFDPFVMDYGNLAIKLLDRHLGVGADGLLLIKENPLEMICYNPDGSRMPMSGNGLRCFAKYCYSHNLFKKNKIDVITGIGRITVELLKENPFSTRLELAKPIFNNSMIGVDDELNCFGRTIRIRDRFVTIYSLFLSDIHTVIFVDDFFSPILEYAEEISNYPLFTKKTNVDFVLVEDKENIKVKTYERRIGFTKASGDGCAASAVAAQKLGLTKTNVCCHVDMDSLKVEITKKGIIYVTGGAKEIFECDFNEEE